MPIKKKILKRKVTRKPSGTPENKPRTGGSPASSKKAKPTKKPASPGLPSSETLVEPHPVADKLPELTVPQLDSLKASMFQSDEVKLHSKILVTKDGQIADGNNRARLLRDAGYGDQLEKQLQQRTGDWVEAIPDAQDPVATIAQLQLGRRNCTKSQVAIALIDEYRKAAKAGTELRGKRGSKKPDCSPVDEFCDKVGISKAYFNRVDFVACNAFDSELEELEAGKANLNSLYRRVKERIEPSSETRFENLELRDDPESPSRKPLSQRTERIQNIHEDADLDDPDQETEEWQEQSSSKVPQAPPRTSKTKAATRLPMDQIQEAASSLSHVLKSTDPKIWKNVLEAFLEGLPKNQKQRFAAIVCELSS